MTSLGTASRKRTGSPGIYFNTNGFNMDTESPLDLFPG